MMWTFVFLYILCANICQAVAEDSTQMHYAKMIIDKSVLEFMPDTSVFDIPDLKIEDFKITTMCKNEATPKECECSPGYRWSEKTMKSLSCSNGTLCTFQENSAHMCISNNTVTINGSMSFEGLQYKDCLQDKDSQNYKKCHDGLFEKMKTQFSFLRGFDTLKITGFSIGSIIAYFEMTIANNVTIEDLKIRSENLTNNLNTSLNLETAGIVVVSMPNGSVPYHTETTIECRTKDDLGVEPDWYLKRTAQEFKITNGIIAKLTSQDLTYTVKLSKVDELWEGEYRCVFTQKLGNTTIYHKANGTMDVCLLPQIEAFTEPGYPLCETSSPVYKVKVKCQIKNSSEKYIVTWTGDVSGMQPEGDNLTYTAEKVVSCQKPNTVFPVTCNFKNKCGQSAMKSVDINIIYAYANDKYCAKEGDWGNTKADQTVALTCKDKSGQRTRTCNSEGVWQTEQSSCVSFQLYSVLESAKIANIGLGELEENVANVFHHLEKVTKTKDVDSPASINVSIEVFHTLKETTIQSNTTINNMLHSSSNLLNKSLENIWTAPTLENNSSLPSKYLISLEELIENANITEKITKENLEVDTCVSKQCNISVFNVTVTLKNEDNDRVKTTGFKHMEGYLPTNRSQQEPNSIVVTVTKNNTLDEITINFHLNKSRPRNVELKCVSWDNETNDWTSRGCEWGGPYKEGQCVCNHLSSFSILMSKHPIKVPGLTLVTNIGLSVSVISLVFCLFIQIIVWNDVVKSNTLYLRHTAHVNISLCLLVGNCCFLASPEPDKTEDIWCKTFAVVKHFCYLSMFFWMLCLSTTLLHQAVFLFHKMSKKSYLRFSMIVGYVCPLLIVFVTFLATEAGSAGSYYSKDTCWLVYDGLMKGTFFTFIIPVGIIVFVNLFSMLVVIMKLLDHHSNAETSAEKEKAAAITVLRSVIFLTPIFGVTWVFGFAVLAIDLTAGPEGMAVNYIFDLLNAFQGFFILLTTCVTDQRTREALMNRFKIKAPASSSESTSTTKLETTWKK